MFIFVLIIHILAAILLIIAILMQSGRGGGLTETFSSMESIFGTKTNVFLVRATTVLSILFLITCLSLAHLSTQRGKSLLEKQPLQKTEAKSVVIPEAEPKPEEVAQASAEPKEIVEPITTNSQETAQQAEKEIESTEEPIPIQEE
jgi:preprotein translocase subunit SecG